MFPRSFYTYEPSFNTLFRLLEDFDNYAANYDRQAQTHGHRRRHVPTFNPKFDVTETDTAYELHGELAGLEKDNVSLEFTDPQTLVIRGRVERKYESGTPPSAPAAVEEPKMSGALTDGEWHEVKGHQATVEDEKEGETETTVSEAAAPTPSTTTEVTKQPAPAAPAAAPKVTRKYWVSERSVGEFSRTFSFPSRIQQEAVTAKLENGVLSVTVPKAKKYESRRITIN